VRQHTHVVVKCASSLLFTGINAFASSPLSQHQLQRPNTRLRVLTTSLQTAHLIVRRWLTSPLEEYTQNIKTVLIILHKGYPLNRLNLEFPFSFTLGSLICSKVCSKQRWRELQVKIKVIGLLCGHREIIKQAYATFWFVWMSGSNLQE
jgi:hypothetical protein